MKPKYLLVSNGASTPHNHTDLVSFGARLFHRRLEGSLPGRDQGFGQKKTSKLN